LLILASKSPRRREILTNAGLAFEVRAAEVEEVRLAQESAIDYVQRLAREKAEALLRDPGDIVLGADTVVLVGGVVLEKPESAGDAASMLEALAGRGHDVTIWERAESGNASLPRATDGPAMAAYAELITEILGEERGVLRQGDRGSNVAGDGPGRST